MTATRMGNLSEANNREEYKIADGEDREFYV
jgi:hypothetical protein